MNTSGLKTLASSPTGLLAAAAAGAAAVTAAWVGQQARRAEREHPPAGRLIDVDGVRLHVVERGEGPAVVLLHGNAVTVDDFATCGLIDRLAATHRVIAFDRPGFGHSSRPRDRLWTPSAQGALLRLALRTLGAEQPVVVGHSMGATVALAMALDFPTDVQKLVLIGGYYYPTARLDAVLTAPAALPVIGDVLRYTVSNLTARVLLKSMVKGMFAPMAMPAGYIRALSREMLVRPQQLRADAEDGAFLVPAAFAASRRLQTLRLPVTLMAGSDDLVVDTDAHSRRLHAELAHSELIVVPGCGHMAHHAVPEGVVSVVAGAAEPRLKAAA